MTKTLLLTTALLALATPALAQIGGDSINQNSGVANNGTIQNSTINNGSTGAGSFSPTSSSTATGGTAIAGGGSADARSSANQAQGQTQSATSGVSGSGNSSVSIKGQKQAPAVVPPGLAATFDCLGSFSGGIGIPGAGISIGGTQPVEECLNAYTARLAREFGEDQDTQIAYLCEGSRYAKHSKKCRKNRGIGSSDAVYRDDVVNKDEFPAGGSANDRRYR